MVCTCLFIFCGNEIFAIFVPEKDAYEAGGLFLRIDGYSQLFMMLEITLQGVFYGMGRTMPPAIISVTCNYLRIPMALWFVSLGWGLAGIWWCVCLTSLGLKMSTGLIIDSRCDGLLFTDAVKATVPLLRPSHIKSGQISFPQPVKKQYVAPVSTNLVQKNKNMVLIKRVPAKSDERFVNSAIYMAAQLPSYRYISTHNKINFIDTKDKNAEMCPRLVFGLYALLNSTIYDRYISIISKSKQINSKEMRSLPLPPRNIIENIGMRLMSLRQTSTAACDQIVNPTLHISEKRD